MALDDSTTRLQELGDGCHAYLQPGGGWGWSNAGLIVGDGQSLLVDTLFDLRLTEAMLDAMAPLTAAAPVSSLVNTHANGDHCYGNSEVTRRWSGADIVASSATAHEMPEVPPAMLAAFEPGPRRRGGAVPQLLRRVRLRRHRTGAADHDVRRQARRSTSVDAASS